MSVCLRRFIFQVMKKKTTTPASPSVLNSYNYSILVSVFYSRNVCVSNRNIYISYFHSYFTLLFLLVFAVGISLLFLFFSRGARGHAFVMVNDPFSDLPFLVVKNLYDLRSQIRFWILPKKRTLKLSTNRGCITSALQVTTTPVSYTHLTLPTSDLV